MRGLILIVVIIALVVGALFNVDAGLFIAYFLIGTAVLTAIFLPLFNALKSPGELKKPLIAIAVIVVLFLISYSLTGSELTAEQAAKGITQTTSKLVGAGLTMFYLVAAIAIGGLIYSEINKAIK